MTKDFKEMRSMMKQLFDNEELLNGTVVTEDGGIFKVHLEFIAGVSQYFLRVIMAAKDPPLANILIPGISKIEMKNIIDFIYTGHLELSLKTIGGLVKTGAMLEMPCITKLCKKHLMSILNKENCMAIYTSLGYSKIYGLKDEVQSYICRHFQEIFPVSSDYLNLDVNDLIAILNSDNLDVTDEDYIFWAIMKWVEHDTPTRIKYLHDLLTCIRFGVCDPQFYTRNIECHPFIRNKEEYQVITHQVSELLSYYQPSNFLLHSRHYFLRPRTPTEFIFVMGGWREMAASNTNETFDIKSGRWFILNVDTKPRAYHGMLWHEGYIYLVGGFNGIRCLNDVIRFDPVLHDLEEKGCMNLRRCYVSVAVLGKHIYAMGGFDGHRRSNSCERYDPGTNQWTMMAHMNEVRCMAGADSFNGKVYIAGGFNGHQILDTAECYDPTIDRWILITNMPSPRSDVKLITYNGCLFVIGGVRGNITLKTVEKYDPRKYTWTSVPDLNSPRKNFATTIMYDCLYVIGGYNGFDTTSAVERYDHRRNVWTVVTELNVDRSALGACTVKDIPNIKEYTFLGNAP